jgi:hypothetical protein
MYLTKVFVLSGKVFSDEPGVITGIAGGISDINKQVHGIMRKILLLLIVVFFIYSCSEENDVPEEIPYGSIYGVVLNEYGQPIENTILEVDERTTKTDSEGRFGFKKIKPGVYTISAFQDFFLTENRTVEIKKDSTTKVTFELKAGQSYLMVSDSIFEVNSMDGFINISVKSNSEWIIKNKSAWIEVSSDKGEGNSTIRLSWNKHFESDEYRSDSVLITTGNQSIYLKVKQSFPIRIKEVKGIIGNELTGIPDSVLLVFNQPIIVNSIKSNYDICFSDINYSVLNKNSVRFTFGCAKLGGEFPFSISVRNNKADVLQEDIVVPFFDSYIEFDGLLKDFKLSEDEQFCWATTSDPNRLYCVDIKGNSIRSAFDLDFEPGRLTYNPYNGYWYVLPAFGPHIDIFSSCFYVIDPENRKIVEKIIIEQDEYDHPENPYVHPYDLVFSPGGLGVIVLKNPRATGGKWRIIESYNDDKMFYHPFFMNQNVYNFDNVFLNYKNEIIAAGYRENSLSFITKDEVKQFNVDPKFRSDEYYAGGVNAVKRFHKLENKYYVAASPGSQCIINLDNDVYSNVLLVESREATADFSYRPGDNNIIFHEVDMNFGIHLFHVLDFNQNKVVMISDMVFNLKNITSLKEGTTVLMTKVDYNKFTSRFYKFQTDIFFK